jgi:hypothetical protein
MVATRRARVLPAPRDVVVDDLSNRFTTPSFVERRTAMDTSAVIVEIRAAEGGADAKLLVEEQLAIYVRLGGRRSL